MLVVPLSALPLSDSGAVLLALRLQEAHGRVGGGPGLDQRAQLVRGGKGQDSHREGQQQNWHLQKLILDDYAFPVIFGKTPDSTLSSILRMLALCLPDRD